MTDIQAKREVLDACKQGIAKWQQAFNNQDAEGCANCYTQDAIMVARPFGTFTGRAQIQAFWQQIIDDGFCDVSYTEVKWEQESDNRFTLSSKWTMNKAYGLVHKEIWQVGEDGFALLADDEFEVLGER